MANIVYNAMLSDSEESIQVWDSTLGVVQKDFLHSGFIRSFPETHDTPLGDGFMADSETTFHGYRTGVGSRWFMMMMMQVCQQLFVPDMFEHPEPRVFTLSGGGSIR